jgi:hypothetical protein
LGLHHGGGHARVADNHLEVGLFIDVFVGVNVGYNLNESFQSNYFSRLNTLGAFRNSLSLSYMFNVKDEQKVRYYE